MSPTLQFSNTMHNFGSATFCQNKKRWFLREGWVFVIWGDLVSRLDLGSALGKIQWNKNKYKNTSWYLQNGFTIWHTWERKKAHEIECWPLEIYISDKVVVRHVKNQFPPLSLRKLNLNVFFGFPCLEFWKI